MDRMLEVEQKAVTRPAGGGNEGKSWGQRVVESEAFKNAKGKDGKGKPEMEAVEVGSWHKAPIMTPQVQTAGTVNYMTPAERAPFVAGTERNLVVRNLIPVMQTESNLIEFARENVFTNAAAPQGGGGSPSADSEGQPKAESALTFTFVQTPVITIAHWIPASRQVLADAKMLGSYIDQRLRYGVMLEEEDEVLNSTGTNGELNGLISQATAFNRSNTSDQELDQLLEAFLQVTLSDYVADGVVLSWIDWTRLMKLKDTQGRYIFSQPQDAGVPRVWGRPVVPSNSMTAGNFLTGAFQLACALWDREQATVRVADQHSDFFVRNMVVILAEERVALAVYRPTALVKGTFHTGGQPG
jgi:HK97 family phage major capsid protein